MVTALAHIRSVVTPEGAAILDMHQDLLIALNTSGAQVWEAFQRGDSIPVIAERLACETGAEPRLVEEDVRLFLEELRVNQLIPSCGR